MSEDLSQSITITVAPVGCDASVVVQIDGRRDTVTVSDGHSQSFYVAPEQMLIVQRDES